MKRFEVITNVKGVERVQRSRDSIERELKTIDNLNSRIWVGGELTLETLLDIRDLLQDMQEWLPTRE
jgi:hypothetical protein